MQTPFVSHCTNEFSIDKDGCELLDLIGMVAKVESLLTFTAPFCSKWLTQILLIAADFGKTKSVKPSLHVSLKDRKHIFQYLVCK